MRKCDLTRYGKKQIDDRDNPNTGSRLTPTSRKKKTTKNGRTFFVLSFLVAIISDWQTLTQRVS